MISAKFLVHNALKQKVDFAAEGAESFGHDTSPVQAGGRLFAPTKISLIAFA
jgi:hypothetical protein